MKKSSFLVDGMLSGTGIRDRVRGGYIDLADIGLSEVLRNRIKSWLLRYEHAFYFDFENRQEVDDLDSEGISIAKCVEDELPDVIIGYYSNADLREIALDL